MIMIEILKYLKITSGFNINFDEDQLYFYFLHVYSKTHLIIYNCRDIYFYKYIFTIDQRLSYFSDAIKWK